MGTNTRECDVESGDQLEGGGRDERGDNKGGPVKYSETEHSNANQGTVDHAGRAATADVDKRGAVRGESMAVKDVRKRLLKMGLGAGKMADHRSCELRISTRFAELITNMSGCICRYVRKKSKVSRIGVRFSCGKSNKWILSINGTNDQIKRALKLLNGTCSFK